MFTMDAIYQLQEAGYAVTPAEGVPGLWNVAGLARDVTTGQLCDLASRHGQPWIRYPVGPVIRTDQMS